MYTLKDNQFVISENQAQSLSVLRDANRWEHFSEEDLREHFTTVQALLLDRISNLGDQTVYLTGEQEKEIHFIFEALLQSKLYLQDLES